MKIFAISRLVFLAFISLMHFNCNTSPTVKLKDYPSRKIPIIECKDNFDSQLLKLAKDFKATTIDLNSSLSPEIKIFLKNVDVKCLRENKYFEQFIVLLLEKLALHHLHCCNQGYDLYQMRVGEASIIINEFNLMGRYKEEDLEILDSLIIADYIRKNPSLKNNISITSLLELIEKEERRIKNGVF